MASPSLNPFAPEALERPHDLYARLREEAPIFELPDAGLLLVTRFDLVHEAASRPRDFSSKLVAVFLESAGRTPGLVDLTALEGARPVDVLATTDPPEHTRQRKLAGGCFSMRRVAALEPRVRRLVDELLDGIASRGRAELMGSLAVALPMTLIVDLLGFDRADLVDLVRWSDAAVASLSGVGTPDEFMGQAAQILELQAYIVDRFEAARAHPDAAHGDVRGDVMRSLVAACVPREDGDALSPDEAQSMLLQLFIAGNESTASLIGSALRMLAEDPALAAELRARPERIAIFVEEVLRLESPFQGHFRVATCDTRLGDVEIARGTRLMLMWGAANRDGHAFDDPDRVRLDRPNPRAHLAFGVGIHSCIGAPLARLEARVAIERALLRLSKLALAEPPPRHRPSLFVRRLAHLHLSFDPQ